MTNDEYNYWVNSLALVCNSVRNNLPYKTGRMKTNTKFHLSILDTQLLGEIVIDVPYAEFVNEYGIQLYPNSEKLRRDYHIVERSTINALRSIYQSKGAIVEYE